MQTVPDFGLSSRQCYLLLALENSRTLSELAGLVGRDPSVISRELKSISALAPVLEKRGGSWHLTDVGRQLTRWTRGAVASQREILGHGTVLTVAASPAFASCVLTPNLYSFTGMTETTQISIATAPGGIEEILLSGKCDIGFEVGRPNDPTIRFKKVVEVPVVVVASAEFLRRHNAQEPRDLVRLPHLYIRQTESPLPQDKLKVLAYFDDPLAVREGVKAGVGWSILPVYVVREEVSKGELSVISGWKLPSEQLGVWWLAESPRADAWVERAIRWLSGQSALLK